jgi:pilus assembly protein FimV
LLLLLLLVLLLLRRGRQQALSTQDSVLAEALRRHDAVQRGVDSEVTSSVAATAIAGRPTPTKPAADTRFDLRWDDESAAEEQALVADPANSNLQDGLEQVRSAAGGDTPKTESSRPAHQEAEPLVEPGSDIDVDALVEALSAPELDTPSSAPTPAADTEAAESEAGSDFDFSDWELEPIEPTQPRRAFEEDELEADSAVLSQARTLDKALASTDETSGKGEDGEEGNIEAAAAEIPDGEAGEEVDDEDFSLFLSPSDEAVTKLNLARAYMDMDDLEGAREVLQEVIDQGDAAQVEEATRLMASLD